MVPDGIVRAMGGNLKVAAVPLSDGWAVRNLVICVRDEAKLTASARLMLEHLRGEEAPLSGGEVGRAQSEIVPMMAEG
jgi:hypothetical protein